MVCLSYKEIYIKDNVHFYLAELLGASNDDLANKSSDTSKYQLNGIDGFPDFGTSYSFAAGSTFHECDTDKTYVLDETFEWRENTEVEPPPAPSPIPANMMIATVIPTSNSSLLSVGFGETTLSEPPTKFTLCLARSSISVDSDYEEQRVISGIYTYGPGSILPFVGNSFSSGTALGAAIKSNTDSSKAPSATLSIVNGALQAAVVSASAPTIPFKPGVEYKVILIIEG